MHSYKTDNGLFCLLKSVNIHDIIIMDEYEKYCLVILDKHSERSVLVQVIWIIWAWKKRVGNCMRSGKKKGNLMRIDLHELLLTVFWQFLNPEAHNKWKTAITNSRYCWELTEPPGTWQFLRSYTQIERVCGMSPSTQLLTKLYRNGVYCWLMLADRCYLFQAWYKRIWSMLLEQRKLAAAPEESPRESSKNS